jgi:hypothetical protein
MNKPIIQPDAYYTEEFLAESYGSGVEHFARKFRNDPSLEHTLMDGGRYYRCDRFLAWLERQKPEPKAEPAAVPVESRAPKFFKGRAEK